MNALQLKRRVEAEIGPDSAGGLADLMWTLQGRLSAWTAAMAAEDVESCDELDAVQDEAAESLVEVYTLIHTLATRGDVASDH